MAGDESYELTPHTELIELKKQLRELRSRVDKASPRELINSMTALTKSIDAMLKLFNQAAEELKFEEKEGSLTGEKSHSVINEKLDKLIDQNKIIAEGIVTVSEMVEDFSGKQKKPDLQQNPPEPNVQPTPKPDFQPPPSFEAELDQLPKPQQQGPVAMPSVPFSSLDEPPKPKKKNWFGRLKK